MADENKVATSAAAKLFDIRVMIGGLFTVYGVLLIIYGFFTSEEDIAQAAGIHINLWLGAGMLLLGLVFLLWARLAPTRPPIKRSGSDGASSRPGGH
jgi:predicted phage tail protein